MDKGRGEERSSPERAGIALDKTLASSDPQTSAPPLALEETLEPHDGATGSLALEATIATASPDATPARGVPGGSRGGELHRGASLGRYVVLDLLGKGGMGEVYTAYDPELDRRVALKVIHSLIRAGGNPDAAKARLLREAQTLAKLSHPNVVAVYDVGEISGDIYVAMEFVEGADLGAWLDADHRSLADILDVFQAAAGGLAMAHAAGLVHRDVKPDNLLIGADGRVRLIDFGIARIGDDPEAGGGETDELVVGLTSSIKTGDLAATRAGMLLGTPAYMAPEQFAGCVADARCDQFSLCVALYEAVTGERPFDGTTLPELSDNVLENKRREMPIGSSVPPWLGAALERGLAPDPDDRFADMTELAGALTPPQPRTSPALWLLVGALALVAIGGVGYAAVRGGASPDPCANAASEIEAVWNSDRRQTISASFQRASDELGVDTADRTSARLDQYASSWSRARLQTCRETAVGELSPSTGERKLACLESRLSELRAVVAVLASADTELIENAVQMTSALTSVESCSNLTRLVGAPEIAPEIESALATIKALERGGSYKQANEAAVALLARTEELGSDVGRARALVWRGRTESQLGLGDEAAESLFEAVRLAELAGDTAARAEAWTYLIFVAGIRQARLHDALRWSKHAEVAIKQDGAPLEMESKRVYHTALIQRGLRRYEQALGEFRQAARLAEKAFGPGTFEVLLAKMGEAMTYRSLERLDAGVALYREILTGMTAQLGEENPRLAIVHSNLGLGLVAAQRYDEGRAHYERAVALKRAKLGDDHPSVLITEANLASLEEKLGNYARAEAEMLAVHERRLKRLGPNYPQLASSLVSIARVATKRGELARAAELLREAIVIDGSRGADARESTAFARATLCDVRRMQRRLASARLECAAAIKMLREKVEDPRSLATALSIAGHVESDAGAYSLAATLGAEAETIRDEHPSNPLSVARTRFVVASAMAADPGRRDEALALARAVEKEVGALHVGDRFLAEPVAQLIAKLTAPP